MSTVETSPYNERTRVSAHLNPVDWIALVLVIIGGLNWGLIAAVGVDLVASIFGAGTVGARIVYGLVGLAALYTIFLAVRLGAKNQD